MPYRDDITPAGLPAGDDDLTVADRLYGRTRTRRDVDSLM